MRYYAARQQKHSGKWHYSYLHDGMIKEVGYCLHDGGHPVKRQAELCYRRYLLDKRLRINTQICDPRVKHQCEVKGCEEMTHGGATVSGTRQFFLCKAHRNREVVDKLLPEFAEMYAT